MLLDARLIVERRVDLGLSRPALARRVAKSGPVIERLERGDNHERLTVGLLAALASELGLQPRDLFSTTQGSAAEPDDTRVEAALAMVGKGLSATELAEGLGWPHHRVLAALEALRKRLGPTGVNLHQRSGRWRLGSRVAVLSREEQGRIEQARVATARLSIYDAQVLAEVVAGKVTARWVADATNAQQVSLATLVRLGYAESDGAGFKPARSVGYSLGVERSGPSFPTRRGGNSRRRKPERSANRASPE